MNEKPREKKEKPTGEKKPGNRVKLSRKKRIDSKVRALVRELRRRMEQQDISKETIAAQNWFEMEDKIRKKIEKMEIEQ